MKKLLLGLLLISGGSVVHGMGKVPPLLLLAQKKVNDEIAREINSGRLSPSGIIEYFQKKGLGEDFYEPSIRTLILTNDQLSIAQKLEIIEAVKPMIDEDSDEDSFVKNDLQALWAILSVENENGNFIVDQDYKGTLVNKLLRFVEYKDEEGEEEPIDETILQVAANRGFYSLVQSLIDYYGADINMAGSNGTTPLHDAVQQRNLEMVQLLIDAGADVNAEDNEGESALQFLVMDPGVYMEAFGIEPTRENRAKVKNNQRTIMQLLISNGANFTDSDKEKLFISAAKDSGLDFIKLLIESGLNVRERREDGVQLIHRAAKYGAIDLIEFLEDNGANIFSKDDFGNTVLHFAGSPEMIEWLIRRKGFEVDVINSGKVSKLHSTVMDQDVEAVTMLLNRGADIDIRDDEGNTPLHYAAEYGNIELVKLLVDREADVNVRNKLGDTPLFNAVVLFQVDPNDEDERAIKRALVSLLLDHGADVSVTNSAGNTVLDMAKIPANNVDQEIITLLGETPQEEATGGEGEMLEEEIGSGEEMVEEEPGSEEETEG